MGQHERTSSRISEAGSTHGQKTNSPLDALIAQVGVVPVCESVQNSVSGAMEKHLSIYPWLPSGMSLTFDKKGANEADQGRSEDSNG